MDLGRAYLDDVLLQLRKLRELGERAMAQVSDAALLGRLDPEANSIAVIVQHMAGNMRSRWTDFLTTDGEKPSRDRDAEFVQEGPLSRDELLRVWEHGWEVTLQAIGSLDAGDLQKVVTVRGEPHTVLEALNRQMTHYAQHVGQILLLAKHAAGPGWQSLSIPKGQSRRYDVAKNGQPFSV